MPNPHRYFVEERKDGTFAVIGEDKDKSADVVNTEPHADRLAHHYAGRGGVVEFKDKRGKFMLCPCHRCKTNRRAS